MVNPAMDSRERFVRLLNAAAAMTGVALSEDIVAIYVSAIAKNPGFDVAFRGLMELFTGMKPGRGFPSIEEIRAASQPPDQRLLPEDIARDASSKAIAAVSKYGWPNADRAREYMGELAWRAVDRMGGWTHFCEILSSNNTTTMQAQMRDLVTTLIARDKAGCVDAAPALPQSQQLKNKQLDVQKTNMVQGLIDDMSKCTIDVSSLKSNGSAKTQTPIEEHPRTRP